MPKASDLVSSEFNPYFSNYIIPLGDIELVEGLKQNLKSSLDFLNDISEDKFSYAYAETKWTIKSIIQHLIDSERIFGYRALCFARGESQNLPGFEQDDYNISANTSTKSKDALITEYKSARKATIDLFSGLAEDALKNVGQASGNEMSARAAGFLIIGHENHHLNVIKHKYL